MQNKIMLIDDDHVMLILLETLLELEGCLVVTAGREQPGDILTKVIAENPNVILLDVNMNQCNGLDLLSAIRSNTSLDNIRIIMSSGIDVKDECLLRGAQGFILKPYMPDELIQKVRLSLQA